MILVVLALLGLGAGSFVHALTWRMHEWHVKKKLTQRQKDSLSIIRGRSMCSHCGHELSWRDLIPVISWVSLRGKCRYCGHKIEDNPLVEAGTALAFVWSYWAWPFGFDGQGVVLFVFWLLLIVGFISLIVYDIKWMELPNKIVYSLIGLLVAQILFQTVIEGDVSVLVQAFWGFMVIGGLFYVLFQISGGRWIGGGDVKLGFVIGPLVGGPLAALIVIFLASLLGTAVSLPLIIQKTLKIGSRIPFGPFLLAATAVVYLYGDRFIDFYWSMI